MAGKTARGSGLAVGLMAAAVAGGCAGSSPLETTAMGPPGAPYQLSAEEQGYDCKKLTGLMQVRILQIRDYESSAKGSFIARGIQGAVSKATSSSAYGSSPDDQYARDRARLEAYNGQLKAKTCKTFDLDAELKPGQPATATPYPVADSVPEAADKKKK